MLISGPGNDDPSKKHKLVTANDAAAAYDPSGSQDLPSWITERVRPCQRVTSTLTSHPHPQQQPSAHPDPAHNPQPEFILYWMRTAIRGHENPALDVAKHEAQQQGLPLLVAAFVLTSHPYPTARRFKFWMEGLRDTQRELRAQAGVSETSIASPLAPTPGCNHCWLPISDCTQGSLVCDVCSHLRPHSLG